MEMWLMILLYSVGGLLGLGILIGAIRAGKPFRNFVSGALQGACALAAVNVAGAFTGVSIGINLFSGVVCLVTGLPGIVTVLLLKLIFGI